MRGKNSRDKLLPVGVNISKSQQNLLRAFPHSVLAAQSSQMSELKAFELFSIPFSSYPSISQLPSPSAPLLVSAFCLHPQHRAGHQTWSPVPTSLPPSSLVLPEVQICCIATQKPAGDPQCPGMKPRFLATHTTSQSPACICPPLTPHNALQTPVTTPGALPHPHLRKCHSLHLNRLSRFPRQENVSAPKA